MPEELPKNRALKPFSTELRKNATEEENLLWYQFLRTYPIQFYRQRIIGNYIADFYCPKAKLVIELDGSQHAEESARIYDARRTLYLEQYGLMVIRFPNWMVHREFKTVCRQIDTVVQTRTADEEQED